MIKGSAKSVHNGSSVGGVFDHHHGGRNRQHTTATATTALTAVTHTTTTTTDNADHSVHGPPSPTLRRHDSSHHALFDTSLLGNNDTASHNDVVA